MAASLIGGNRWEAGEALMDRASPDTFDRMARLYQACGDQAAQLCEAAMAVRTGPPIIGHSMYLICSLRACRRGGSLSVDATSKLRIVISIL
jgi:hypothetical protein